MKCLSTQEANVLLENIGMAIGDWNEITDILGRNSSKPFWINYRAPKDNLLNFSHHVAGWLAKGNWKIFQIDNSTGWIDPVQLSLFGGLLFGADKLSGYDPKKNKTFFFEFGKNENADSDTELLISNLIYIFLMFESHGYVVSSNSNAGQLLGVQDGFVYFMSKEKSDIADATALVERFKQNPSAPPQWINEIYAHRQDQVFNKQA